MVGGGIDDVARAMDAVVFGASVSEIIERQILESGLLALEFGEVLEALPPVEVGIGQDVAATRRAASQAVEVREFARVCECE